MNAKYFEMKELEEPKNKSVQGMTEGNLFFPTWPLWWAINI